jgi:hypothetical protein
MLESLTLEEIQEVGYLAEVYKSILNLKVKELLKMIAKIGKTTIESN